MAHVGARISPTLKISRNTTARADIKYGQEKAKPFISKPLYPWNQNRNDRLSGFALFFNGITAPTKENNIYSHPTQTMAKDRKP
ncbi:MAG: hypothetical protein MI747_05755, partial [Desulfobacterales bacterium]|nr:hypothetical protein [Desulfobacterales bacterium]